MEQLIVIDCFTSMGLHLKHFKATQVQEVRWLMPLESHVLYNAPIGVHKMETRKPITHKKMQPTLKTYNFERWRVKLSQNQTPQETYSFLFPFLDSFKVGVSYSH